LAMKTELRQMSTKMRSLESQNEALEAENARIRSENRVLKYRDYEFDDARSSRSTTTTTTTSSSSFATDLAKDVMKEVVFGMVRMMFPPRSPSDSVRSSSVSTSSRSTLAPKRGRGRPRKTI